MAQERIIALLEEGEACVVSGFCGTKNHNSFRTVALRQTRFTRVNFSHRQKFIGHYWIRIRAIQKEKNTKNGDEYKMDCEIRTKINSAPLIDVAIYFNTTQYHGEFVIQQNL